MPGWWWSATMRGHVVYDCQPWSFLRLLGNIPGGQRAQLTPRARVTMNHAALTRLAGYLGKPTDDLARAMPSIVADERWNEPTVLIHQLGRAFLRSCTQCEKRAGGAVLMPNPHPMQLNCQRHNTWLVTAEDIDLDKAPTPSPRCAASEGSAAATATTSSTAITNGSANT